MLKWSLFMSRWQLRNFFAKLRNSRPVKTLMRLMIIKSTSHPKRMAGRGDGTRATLLLAVCESLARCQDTAGLSSAARGRC